MENSLLIWSMNWSLDDRDSVKKYLREGCSANFAMFKSTNGPVLNFTRPEIYLLREVSFQTLTNLKEFTSFFLIKK